MGNKTEYYIHGVNGPVIKVRGGRSLPRMSLVYVGEQRLFGERKRCSLLQPLS